MYPEEQKMPHEMYNWIVDRCFDCCVGTFDHKHLIKGEKECIDKCVHNLKNLPLHYQDTQKLQGFLKAPQAPQQQPMGMQGFNF